MMVVGGGAMITLGYLIAGGGTAGGAAIAAGTGGAGAPAGAAVVSAGVAAGKAIAATGSGVMSAGLALLASDASGDSGGNGNNNDSNSPDGSGNNGGNNRRLTNREGRIAEETGYSKGQIRDAIHNVKREGLPRSGPRSNPDVQVDLNTGEVYPEVNRGVPAQDSIGNIFDFLP